MNAVKRISLLLFLLGAAPARAQDIHVVAGTGSVGYSGDGGPAVLADLNYNDDVAVDAAGNFYISDSYNYVVRRVDASTGSISTVAGSGTPGYSGDGGPADLAEMQSPAGLALDAAGNLYVADSFNRVVRRVDASTGFITTVVGVGAAGCWGDGGPAILAELGYPYRIEVRGGGLFIADTGCNVVRRVDFSTGVITTVAGNGTYGYSGDGGPASLAGFGYLGDLAVDGAGNLYILDMEYLAVRIRRVDAVTGIITTIAGGGSTCMGDVSYDPTGVVLGDESAYLGALAADASGDLYIAIGCVVYRLEAGGAMISRCAGTGVCGFAGDGGPALDALIGYNLGTSSLTGLAVGVGGLYINDQGNQRVWRVDDPGSILPATPTPTPVPTGAAPGPGLAILKSASSGTAMPGDILTFCLSLSSPPAAAMVDVVWLIDRTGSMGGVIDSIKTNILSFTGELAATGIDYRLGLVTFVDEPPDPLFNYGFSTSDAGFQTWIDGITIGGGGDAPENDLEAVLSADGMAWRPGAARVMILVTDAPVHVAGDAAAYTHTLAEVVTVLNASGTVLHTISHSFCGSAATNPVELATGTGGMSYPLSSADWDDLLSKLGTSVAAFTGVVLRDVLPPVLEPVPGSFPGGTWDGKELTWDLGLITRGVTVTRCFSSVVTGAFDPLLINTACVNSDGSVGGCSSPVTVEAVPTFTFTPTVALHVWPIPFLPGEAVNGTLKFAVLPKGAQVEIFSVSGEKVWDRPERGLRVEWDGRNDKGNPCAPGIYYYVIRAGDRILLKGKFVMGAR
jgi:hypothetical protein